MAKLVKLDLGLVLTKIINKMNTIPSLIDGYLKNASVAGNKLTIVKMMVQLWNLLVVKVQNTQLVIIFK